MSTPADERAALIAEHAANLADQTAYALIAVRTTLNYAADAADQVDTMLRRAENEIDELSSRASLVRTAETAEEAEPHLRLARDAANDLTDDLQRVQRGVDEVREHLEAGGRAIADGRSFLDELDSLPGQRSEANDQLRDRLAYLDRAVHGAMAGVDRTNWRLNQGQQNLEPLLNVPGTVHDQDRSAAVVQEVGADTGEAIGDARGGVRLLREDLDRTRPDAWSIAQDSVELAHAVRAGTNPTPPSAQQAPAASSEQDHRDRTGGQSRGPQLNL